MDVRLTQALKSYGATKLDIKPEATDGLNAFSGAAQDFADTLAKTEQIRRIWPFLRDRRIDTYAPLLKRWLDK